MAWKQWRSRGMSFDQRHTCTQVYFVSGQRALASQSLMEDLNASNTTLTHPRGGGQAQCSSIKISAGPLSSEAGALRIAERLLRSRSRAELGETAVDLVVPLQLHEARTLLQPQECDT